MSTPINFEYLYDRYSSMVYTLALEVSSDEQEAESILLLTFRNLAVQLSKSDGGISCTDLIRLTLKTAHEKLHGTNASVNFKLKTFETTPLLQHFFCCPDGLNGYIIEHKLTRAQGLLQLRKEFNLLRKTVTEADHVQQNRAVDKSPGFVVEVSPVPV